MLRSFAVAAALVLPGAAQVSVLTYQYDNSRAGANAREAILTKSNVNSNQFGKLFSVPVDGYVYAQPLYLPNVTIPGKGTHNVVYVATEHDSAYAFDADSGASLWQVSFLNPGGGVTSFPAADTGCNQIVPEIGITGTPVIDPQSQTIYMVAMTKESGNYVARLHALDLANGAERPGSPVMVQASVPGTGEGGSMVVFQPKNYKQRPGLLLLNGTVYTGWSSHCDGGRYHGWLIGYDAQSLKQISVYNNTPNGNEGSFWAGGAAPAADGAGNIYLVAGNGTFDYASGGPDLGESYIKLSSAGGLKVADYFTPFNYADLNNRDVDVGSAGVALLGDEAGSSAHPHLLAGAGKEGRIYILDRDRMGGLGAGSDAQVVKSLPAAISSLFGNPAYFNQAVYFCGAGDSLKMFPISNAQMASTPGSHSATAFGGLGCVPTFSANGTAEGIAWAIDSSGVLRAYDASNLAAELYDSNQNRTRDAFGSAVKFSVPAVANGKVYAGTQTSLVVYGLLAGAGFGLANSASADVAPMAPGSLASIYGQGLAASMAQAGSLPLQTQLGGATVLVNGVAAPLLYASSTQINFQVPFETAPGPAVVTVMVGGTVVSGGNGNVQALSPGLFTVAGGHAAVLNQDYSMNGPSRPAPARSVISAYMTGLGAVDHPVGSGAAAAAEPLANVTANVTATIGNVAAPVMFSGLAPGFAGLYQVNVQVPQLSAGDYPLLISADGVNSNPAVVSVR